MVKNKNIICIVQARLNSNRLPGKILKKINKKNNVLEFLIKRLKKSKKISKIVITCPDTSEDKKIIKKLEKHKVNFFKGSELNVLDRYFKTAKKFKAHAIIRVTADCPFTDPKLIDKFLDRFFKFKYDYFSNINPPTFPDGFDIEIFNATGGGKLMGDAKLLSMRVYLVDNDLKSGKVEFSSETASIIENEGEVVVAVRRLAGSRGQGSVAYTTRSLTALSGEDY